MIVILGCLIVMGSVIGGFVIGAVFASGILAKGAVAGAKYAYAEPSAAVLDKTRRIQAVCDRYARSFVS